MANETLQYKRVCTLIVSTANQNGLDLSELHIKFSVKRTDTQTPNMADIRVYNLAEETAKLIKKEFTQVILQAGYESNYGVIFQGNIKQVILGRESATDTFIDIIAGDGDLAYNFAIVNQTLAAGSTQSDQIQASLAPMSSKGVTSGVINTNSTDKLPRGKVMYGNSKEYLRNSADNLAQNWSIQDGKVNFVPLKSYLPGERVVLSSKTGIIGTPQQTVEGVNFKCLLNPRLKISSQVEINNKDVQDYKINLGVPGSPANTPVPLSADGVYYIFTIEYAGDNRGLEWYCNLLCLSIDVSANPRNSVQVGFGG